MKNILSLLLFLLPVLGWTQTINQPGEVRTISYRQGVKGVPIANVRLKSLNEVRSDTNGCFLIPVKAAKNNTFTFTEITKNGYELISSTQFAVNPNVKAQVVMANIDELYKNRREIEQRIRKTHEAEIAAKEQKLQAIEAEINQLRQANQNIAQLTSQDEQMRNELQTLKTAYYSSDEWIHKEAERLARIDYQSIDSVQALITNLLKNGKGNEAIQIAKAQLPPQVWEKILNNPQAIKQKIKQAKQEIARDSALLVQVAGQLKNMADGYANTFQNDSAAFCLRKRIALDSTNYQYMIDYAQFISYYLASYDEALAIFRQCLQISGGEHPQIDILCNNMGTVYYNLGNYPKALAYYQKALAIAINNTNGNHLDIARSYSDIGSVYSKQNNYRQALDYYEKALAIWKKTANNEHPDAATLYNNIALAHSALGNTGQALNYLEKALIIKMKTLGSEHPDIATLYNNIGSVYYSQNHYEKALDYYRKALAIREKVFGNGHPDIAILHNNIATAYYHQGDDRQAITHYQQALTIQEKITSGEHPDIATSYNNIGSAYFSLGDNQKALDYYEKALTIREKIWGNEHYDIAVSYNNIALVHSEKGEYGQALAYLKKALAIWKKTDANRYSNIATSYCNIGSAYYGEGNYKQALTYYHKALAIQQKELGIEHNDTQITQEAINRIKKETTY